MYVEPMPGLAVADQHGVCRIRCQNPPACAFEELARVRHDPAGTRHDCRGHPITSSRTTTQSTSYFGSRVSPNYWPFGSISGEQYCTKTLEPGFLGHGSPLIEAKAMAFHLTEEREYAAAYEKSCWSSLPHLVMAAIIIPDQTSAS